MADWAFPSVITNPLGTLWDVWQAYPFGIFSMAGVAPQGSKEQQIKAVSPFIPATVSVPRTGGLPPVKQSFPEFTNQWITKSKTTSTESKTFWSEDTIPEPFPGFDLLGEYGKYIPLIIIAIVIILVVPRLFGGKK